MSIAGNTYTVTVADTSAHTVVSAGIDASNKLDAAARAIIGLVNELAVPGSPITALVTANTWTITVTQP